MDKPRPQAFPIKGRGSGSDTERELLRKQELEEMSMCNKIGID